MMKQPRITRLAALCAVLAALALPGSAAASRSQQTMVQDDSHLIFSGADTRRATLDEMQRLGVDIVKVRVDWRALAPSPEANSKPGGFSGESPGEYGDRFAPYDEAISGAQARGMRVLVQLGGAAPDWGKSSRNGPDPVEFGRFVRATAVQRE